MYRCSVITCARWESSYIREWLYYYIAIGVDHVYLICNDEDPTLLLSEVHAVHHSHPRFLSFTHFPGQGQQRAMYLDVIDTARAASEWLTFLDVDEFLVLRDCDNVGVFLDHLPADVDSVHFNWLNFGNNGFIERPPGSVLTNYTRRARTLHPNTKHLTRSAKLDPRRLSNAEYPFWHALPDPLWADLKRINAIGADMEVLLRQRSAGDNSYLADLPTNDRIIATAVVHHYMMKSEKDFLLRVERGTEGDFGGQSMWKQEYENGNYRQILASINTVEDRYLADFNKSAIVAEDDHMAMHHKTQPQAPVTIVHVRHRLWSDDLLLGINNRVRHSTHGSLGSYLLADDILLVKWDDWPGDLFYKQSDTYVAREIWPATGIDLDKPQTALMRDREIAVDAVLIAVPGSASSVVIRPGTSDASVFQAVFHTQEYALPTIAEPIHTVVDLGANTGLSSVFFSLRFPSARIIAVEPERGNYEVLCANARPYSNVLPVNAAIWAEDTVLSLETRYADGTKIADWGFQTTATTSATDAQKVEALGLVSLMRRYKLEQIDLLKIDIEGAELELFSKNPQAWLSRTKYLVIETHERFRDGIDSLVSSTLASDFDELPMSGENRVFARRFGVAL